MNTLIGEGKANEIVKQIKLRNGEVVKDNIKIANELNAHFFEISTNKSSISPASLEHRHTSTKNQFPKKCTLSSMFFVPVSNLELVNTVQSMKSRKSPGFDNIRIDLIKKVIGNLSNVLVYLFNLSLSSGKYPKKLKNAIIVPIYKAGEKENPNNYRPIALLPVFAKILEKLVRVRLASFLARTNFYSQNQFGFQKGRNTEDAMLKLMTEVYNGINDNKKCASLFLDIRKAFDTVKHDVLLTKLDNAGIRGLCKSWFKSFLQDRTQQVKIGEALSEKMTVTSGVPQGSGLSAELFLIYIDDLCDGTLKGSITAFADDTALSYCANGREQLMQMLRDDLYSLSAWFQINSLELNTDKSNIIVFRLTSRDENEPALEMPFHSSACMDSNQTSCVCGCIMETNNTKYLGIMIDSNLTWTQQILKLKRGLYSTCRKLYFIRNLCPKYMLRSLYYALVESRLQYGIVVWGGAYFSTLKPLLIGHKYVMRTIARKNRMTNSFPLFKEWEFLPLRYLYFYKVLITFYVRSGDKMPTYSSYNLRSTGNWVPPKPNKEMYRRFYLYVAPRVFNMIPTEVKQLETHYKFRKKLKKWLFEIDDIEELFKKLT